MMPPKGAAKFWYVHISLHKNGLHFVYNFVNISEKIGKRTFSTKIGINKNISENNRE